MAAGGGFGLGFARGIGLGVDAIACDAGSTDSGPSYLARGVSKVSRESIKADLAVLMPAAARAGVPLLIGSRGTAGTDSGVDWTRDIALEVAKEHGLNPKIALLFITLLPQFVASGEPRTRTTAELAATLVAISLVWWGVFALAVGSLSRVLERPAVRRSVEALVGVVLIALAVRVAVGV